METPEIEAGSKFGPYTIEGLVAGGGMGSVYAARHTVYGSTVALKILHADLHADAGWRQRFSKEGLVGLELKHPHILSARDVVMEDDGRVALVLDLVQEGKTLLRVMSREFSGGLPLVQALQMLLGLIQGVEYAHEKGVTHGDIKPENVLIQGEFHDARTWVPKLTDFGTVGIIAHPVTVEGQPAVVVSPRYASPEHIYGMDHLEPRSDIYCLGLLLHYLLTGQHASNASTVAEAAETVTRPVPVAAVVDQPDSIIRIFQTATQVKKEERFESCRAFALAIREALDTIGAELELDDLQADLVTEIMDERRREKRDSLQKRRGAADGKDHETGETAVAPDSAQDTDPEEETELADPKQYQLSEQELLDATRAADEEDTADQVPSFDGRPFDRDADHSAIETEVPSERDFQPEDLVTPAPAGTPVEPRRVTEEPEAPEAPEESAVELAEEPEEPLSASVWIAVVAAVGVMAAILAMNL
ncbi:MAG: serine/threonine protein kinase [Deltaproteobacteria bacterium]|nr:serine/threonine protein kinase [Deltaproteobacteria bacterium]